MYNPRIDADVCHSGKECLRECRQVLDPRAGTVDRLVCKAAVIMGVKCAFVEVFLLWIAIAAPIITKVYSDIEELGGCVHGNYKG